MDKKQKLHLFHRETISAVAHTLFNEKGLEKTTMEEIATQADYSKATLYVYFKNKEEIFLFLVCQFMCSLEQDIHTTVYNAKHTIEKYNDIFDILLDYYHKSPIYFKAMLNTIESRGEQRKESDILETIYQIGEKLNDDIALFIQEGVKQGIFYENKNNTATGLVFWFALSGLILAGKNKTQYIQNRLDQTEDTFLYYGRDLLLKSLLIKGE